MKKILPPGKLIILLAFFLSGQQLKASQPADTTWLRVSFHIFDNEEGSGNFNADSVSHLIFLDDIIKKINHRLLNLDTLKPAVQSEFVGSTGLQIRIDSLFFHKDNYAWDCSSGINSEYMREIYVDNDKSLDYKKKFQTLPVFLGGNYNIVGGHNNQLGDKGFIAMRGLYYEFLNRPYPDAVRDCARGLLHELGHSLGLAHNFMGGPNGDQCDECEDNGCPEEGSSNNIMDYWPAYGYALSKCQMDIIGQHIKGERGTISDVIWNDSCYFENNITHYIKNGEEVYVTDTLYLHNDLIIEKGGRITVSGYLSFPQYAGLIIQDGGELILEGGTIGNLCGDLWEGIRYISNDQGQTSGGGLVLESGVIENARTGIFAGQAEGIDLEGITFRNNVLALDIQGSDTNTKIKNCKFLITGRLNHWEEGEIPMFFVKLRNGSSFSLVDCFFENYEGHRNFSDEESGIGLLLESSDFKLTNCSFRNLYKAIYAGSAEPGRIIAIDSCNFEMCHCAIQLVNFPEAQVTSSEISLNRLNTMASIGVYAQNVPCFFAGGNIFTSDYGGTQLFGIISDQVKPGTHLISNNQFERLGNGILTFNSEGIAKWPDALLLNSGTDLQGLPLGTVWSENSFGFVDKLILNIEKEGIGLAAGKPDGDNNADIKASRSFPLGGFGPFDGSGEFNAILPDGLLVSMFSGDMKFFILSGESWKNSEVSEVKPGNMNEIIADLARELNTGRDVPYGEKPFSHKSLLILSEHLKKYPWLAFETSFKKELLEGSQVMPPWFRTEIENALHAGSNWKGQIHELLVYLASYQVNNQVFSKGFEAVQGIEIENQAKIPVFEELFLSLVRLSLGPVSDSGSPSFLIVPNPGNGEVGIRLSEPYSNLLANNDMDFRILDMAGKVMKSGRIINNLDLIIDARQLKAGSYLLEIWVGNEFLGIQKFIILPD